MNTLRKLIDTIPRSKLTLAYCAYCTTITATVLLLHATGH